MKIRLLFLALLFTTITFGQPSEYKQIKGTKYRMITPEGFEEASGFNGFQNIIIGSSIMLNELPAPYSQISEGFTSENAKKNGMTLISREQIEINGKPAILLLISQNIYRQKYLKHCLIFGDSTTTILLNGIFPEKEKKYGDQLVKSLLTIQFDINQPINILDKATFTINTDSTEFKPVKYFSGMFFYSTDGLLETKGPFFIIGNSLSSVKGVDKKEYAKERISKTPGTTDIIITEIKDIEIDSLSGFEITASAQGFNSGEKMIYQVMLFDEKGFYYIFRAEWRMENAKQFLVFKKIAKSFKRTKAY